MPTTRKIEPPFLRTPYNYDRNQAGDEDAIHCTDESLTRQSFAEEADINTIVNRFLKTGELPQDIAAPTYATFEGVYDFHTAMNAIAQANEAFDAMPAHVRSRFKNDPQQFVEFCSQEENRAEAEKLGLVVPQPAQETPPDPTALAKAPLPTEAPPPKDPGASRQAPDPKK